MPQLGHDVNFVGHLFQQGGEYILCKYMNGAYEFHGIVISVEEGKDFVVFRELTNPVNEVALPNKVVDSNGKIKCHVCVYIINPSVCKECINLSKFTPTSKTSCKGCVHEIGDGTCAFCEEFNQFSSKEAVNKENEEATPMIYPCDMCIHVKVGYPKEGVCSGCKNFDKLDPSGEESAAEVREKYIRYDKAPDELMPMSDEEVSEFIKTRSEYPEELAQECQGSFDEASKGPLCDGCKHIGVNPESGPCAVCFEGMMYESDKACK